MELLSYSDSSPRHGDVTKLFGPWNLLWVFHKNELFSRKWKRQWNFGKGQGADFHSWIPDIVGYPWDSRVHQDDPCGAHAADLPCRSHFKAKRWENGWVWRNGLPCGYPFVGNIIWICVFGCVSFFGDASQNRKGFFIINLKAKRRTRIILSFAIRWWDLKPLITSTGDRYADMHWYAVYVFISCLSD